MRNSMNSTMQLDYAGENEYQYWGQFNVRNYTGDWSNILLLYRMTSPTISVCQRCLSRLSVGTSVC